MLGRLLRRRLRNFASDSNGRKVELCDLLTRTLSPEVSVPASESLSKTCWLYPILIDDPGVMSEKLRQLGFDATSFSAGLRVVEPPEEMPSANPAEARAFMSRLLYLPVYPDMHQSRLLEMAEAIIEGLRESGVEVHVRATREASAFATDPLAAAVQVLAESIGAATGVAPRLLLSPDFLDLRYFAMMGIPAVASGPGQVAVVGSPAECILASELSQYALAYALLALRINCPD